MKMQQASKMVFRRPRKSEYDARNAPQKQPAVNSATTVPERESASFWRKLALKESEATTSAITPLSSISIELSLIEGVRSQIVSEKKRSNRCKAANQELIDA